MTFSASYDRAAKVISVCVCLGLLAVVAALHIFFVSTLLLLIIGVSYAYSPRGYVLADRSILVRRLAGTARIPLDDLREVRRATSDDLRGCIRLAGSAGLFGYYGLFRSTKLGTFSEYVTNRNNRVVVITGSKTALVSPDDVEGFLNAIRASAPIVEGHRAPVPHRSRAFGTAIGAAIGIAAIGLVAAALTYSPGPPGYTLTPTSLTIHDRFYPVTLKPDSIEVSQIRVIDLATDPYWMPASRANGFANSHYQSGWFHLANGQKVRLYRAGSERLVLLPSKNDVAAVLYQAADPEAFVAEIRDAWSASARSSANAGK